MKNFEKDLIFWFGLHKVAGDDMKMNYAISTERDYLFHLADVAFLGLQQYTLYVGAPLTVIDDVEISNYSTYIIENYELLRKVRYRYYNKKVMKLNMEDLEAQKKAKEYLERLIIPYFNKNCFKTLANWKHLIPTYITGMIFNFEYDINHIAKDKKLKTSSIYPFLFTLNLINVQDKANIYKRVRMYFDRKKILKKYGKGRSWKPKEEEYLKETISLLENEEEWNTFISNFEIDKWEHFTLEERFKTLFQLSKVVCILMKAKITSVTMLGNGREEFDLLQNFLPLFLNSDKILNETGNITMETIEKYGKACAPFSQIYLCTNELVSYIETKEQHAKVESEKIKLMNDIIWTSVLKLRILKLNHLYIPEIVNAQIEQKKKLMVDILQIFKVEKDGKYKPEESFEFNLDNFYIVDEEIQELKNVDEHTRSLFRADILYKIGLGLSYVLGLNLPTAKIFNYNIFEAIKYLLTIMGPHPADRTIVNDELMEIVQTKFSKILDWYGLLSESSKIKYKPYFELPYRLYLRAQEENK